MRKLRSDGGYAPRPSLERLFRFVLDPRASCPDEIGMDARRTLSQKDARKRPGALFGPST
jgi:hypothetical protein